MFVIVQIADGLGVCLHGVDISCSADFPRSVSCVLLCLHINCLCSPSGGYKRLGTSFCVQREYVFV